jgi:hypothetical protein
VSRAGLDSTEVEEEEVMVVEEVEVEMEEVGLTTNPTGVTTIRVCQCMWEILRTRLAGRI